MLMNNTINELKKALTSKNVLCEIKERIEYTKDASYITGQLPDVVVFVETM